MAILSCGKKTGRAFPWLKDEHCYFLELAIVVVTPLLLAGGVLFASRISSLPVRIGAYVALPIVSALICLGLVRFLESSIAARQAAEALHRDPLVALPEEGQEMALRVMISFAVGVTTHLVFFFFFAAAIPGLTALMRK